MSPKLQDTLPINESSPKIINSIFEIINWFYLNKKGLIVLNNTLVYLRISSIIDKKAGIYIYINLYQIKVNFI